MSYFKSAIEEIKRKRSEELFLASKLYSDALEINPKLLEAEKLLRSLLLEQAKLKATDQKVPTELIDHIKKAQSNRNAILKNLKITDKMLNPPPSCPLCSDSGTLNGRACRCAVALAINNDKNIKIPLHNFSECNLSIYPENVRSINKAVFETVQKITQLYPNNKRKNIVIAGASGTGKTFLAACAATEILERGYSVTAVTAFELINRALKYHTTFNDEKSSHLEPILESDLLIIDDLGFESILKSITLEYLFMIINERMLSKKLTIITTNLDKDGLYSRYDESVCSRLLDKENAYYSILAGKDKRVTNQ